MQKDLTLVGARPLEMPVMAFPQMLPRYSAANGALSMLAPLMLASAGGLPGASALAPLEQAGYGTIDTEYVDLPANYDWDYLRSLDMRGGMTMADVINGIEARMAALARTTDPIMAMLQAPPTTEVWVDAPAGGELEWVTHTQYVPSRPQMIEPPGGHNLAIETHDVSLGWTEEGLEEMPARRILQNVDGLAAGNKRMHRKRFINRLFGPHEQEVDKKSTATSPGAIGSGTGANAWTPSTFPDGSALPGSYSHYFRVASDASSLRPAIKTAKNYLKKYLGEGTYEVIGSSAGIATLMALTTDATINFQGFVGVNGPLVQPSPNDARALVDARNFVGIVDGDVAIRQPLEDFTAAYFYLGRPLGNFAEGNPIVYRYDEMRGRAAFIRSRGSYPLAQAIALQKGGYNWNNRANGILFKISGAGSYDWTLI